MKLILLLCAVTVVAAEVSNSSRGYHQMFGVPQAEKIRIREGITSRIVGGMPSYVGENPFLAGLIIELTNGLTSVCAGTLLNARKILTAGQCWYDGYWQGKSITAVVGSTRLFSGGERQNVYSIVVHPQFDPIEITNDLAMLSVQGFTLLSVVQPASLPLLRVNETFTGYNARVAGYGVTNDRGQITSAQQQYTVYVQVIPNEQCDALYSQKIDSNMICTSGSHSWGPCNGDGGAPLVINHNYLENILIGVSSFHAVAGCQSGLPFGYMRVTAYLPWIQSLLY